MHGTKKKMQRKAKIAAAAAETAPAEHVNTIKADFQLLMLKKLETGLRDNIEDSSKPTSTSKTSNSLSTVLKSVQQNISKIEKAKNQETAMI